MTQFLLLQVRNEDDPMKPQERRCFCHALPCDAAELQHWDLIQGSPPQSKLDEVDIVLLGGSGDYSVAEGGPWLDRALAVMRTLVDQGKPTFASCWGFQAMARALGGTVVTDLPRAELGSVEVRLTEAGRQDPVFGGLPDSFPTAMGHQDRVVDLPAGVTRLAESDRVDNQAFRITGKPIYCTQFHPELQRDDLVDRLIAYPQYVEKIAGVTIDEFLDQCRETPDCNRILQRFVEFVDRGER